MSSRDDRDSGLPPELDPRRGSARDPRRSSSRPTSGSAAGSGSRGRPPTGGAGGRGGSGGGGDQQRSAAQRKRIILGTVRGIAAVLALVLLASAGWITYLRGVAEAGVRRSDALPSDGNVDAGGDGSAMNILLVGNDSRSSATDEELADKLRTEASDGLNTDTMILVHIPADGSRASVVSFPRDSWVDVPGVGKTKLNSAYANGYASAPDSATEDQRRSAGEQLLVQTISGITGVQVDHYVEVDLLGFYNLTEALGGIDVNLCAPAQDPDSGIDLPAGPQTLNGADALAFVRQRKGLPNGDLDRIKRQQYFIGAVVRKVLSGDTLFSPSKQKALIEAASQNLTVDQNLDLFDLAEQMQNLAAGNVEFRTIPLGDPQFGNEDGQDVVYLADDDDVRDFFANLSKDDDESAAPTSSGSGGGDVTPDKVSLEVLNGSGMSGVAGEAAGALQQQGFTVTGTDNADRSDYQTTTVYYPPGQKAKAQLVAATLPGATTEEDNSLSSNLQLVIGSDYSGVNDASGGGGGDAGAGGGDAGAGGGDAGGGDAGAGAGDAGGGTPPPDFTAADAGCIN